MKIYSPEETWMEDSAAILWDKADSSEPVVYHILLDGHWAAEETATDFTLENLAPEHSYRIQIKAIANGAEIDRSEEVAIRTRKLPPVFDVTKYGAVGDGITLNTKAIQDAIDDCCENGMVYVPAGEFVTGPVFLKSNMILHVEKGGRLQGTGQLEEYRIMNYRFGGKEQECYASLINTEDAKGKRLKNIVIRGKGTIDANGSLLRRKEIAERRGAPGRAICIRNTDYLYFKDIIVRQSPAWCLHTIYCRNVSLNQISVFTKYDENGKWYRNMENGDGFDPDSCCNVNMFRCMIASQDDCIAVKSGKDEEGRRAGIPSENIRITNCEFKSGLGVAMGSEMSGAIRNVLVQDCVFTDVFSVGVVKTPRGRGSIVENVTFDHLRMQNRDRSLKDCKWFRGSILIDSFYGHDEIDLSARREVDESTPTVRNITFKNIDLETADGCAVYLSGLPESSLENVVLQNIKASGSYGMKVNHVKGLIMKNVDIHVNADLPGHHEGEP